MGAQNRYEKSLFMLIKIFKFFTSLVSGSLLLVLSHSSKAVTDPLGPAGSVTQCFHNLVTEIMQ